MRSSKYTKKIVNVVKYTYMYILMREKEGLDENYLVSRHEKLHLNQLKYIGEELTIFVNLLHRDNTRVEKT